MQFLNIQKIYKNVFKQCIIIIIIQKNFVVHILLYYVKQKNINKEMNFNIRKQQHVHL